MKSFMDLHKDEVFTDNTKIEYCKQCKDCKHWNSGDNFGNVYTKSCCAKFKYPDRKPSQVISNTGECQYREI